MTKQALLAKINTLPEDTVDKLEMFVDFLLYQTNGNGSKKAQNTEPLATEHADTTEPKEMSNHETVVNHELPLIDVAEALKGYKSPFPEVNEHTVLDKPTPGIAKGKFWMADDFDEPLEDMMEYMY